MRLIDADELKKYVPSTKVDIFENCRNCKLLDDWQVIDIIDKAPTVDPVKHGHWIKKKPTYTECFVCSECFATGKHHVWSGVDGLNYCPHCGAIMEEVSE